MRTLGLALLVGAVFAACGEADEGRTSPASADPGVVHVHGLGRNPADGALLIATHTGLFRVASGERSPERVAELAQDTMGFTVVGPDRFLGSGHPGRPGDPPFLGLIESRDAGERWRPVSLRGKADFHLLEAQGATVYGFGSDWKSREARFLRSRDSGRTWKRLRAPEALTGLAVDPGDPERVVALGGKQGHVSVDGGASWRPLDVPGGLVTWTSEQGVVAVGFDGVVRRAGDPEGDWKVVGAVGREPAALEGVGEELLAATHDNKVLSSRDGGKSWTGLLGE